MNQLAFSKLPVDILASVVCFIGSGDVVRLWASGDTQLQTRLTANGVVQKLAFFAYARVPSVLAHFPHLRQLELGEQRNDYYYGPATNFLLGFDRYSSQKVCKIFPCAFPMLWIAYVGTL